MSLTEESKFNEETLSSLQNGVKELFAFRDLYFEQIPRPSAADRQKLIEEKRAILLERLHRIDDSTLSGEDRAHYLYLVGRTYNVIDDYDPRATHALCKAVKLAPKLVDAWNELAESYYKNGNVKETRNSLEGALKTGRTKDTLRSLSIILKQQSSGDPVEHKKAIEHSVELAKEAVSLDIKDGVSWRILGNAYLCAFFTIAQDPATIKLCLSAYRQAETDPIARGQCDLYHNKGVAHKYCEQYSEALDCFRRAIELDPTWDSPVEYKQKLEKYLTTLSDVVATRGKIKTKKLEQMAQSIDKKMLADYGDESYLKKINIKLTECNIKDLIIGNNSNKVLLGKVIGSIYTESVVPFTFVLMDREQACVAVTAYNWAKGRGVIIGDSVALPAPSVTQHSGDDPKYNFKSIRVDNPTYLVVNGKRVKQNQVAATTITIKHEPV